MRTSLKDTHSMPEAHKLSRCHQAAESISVQPAGRRCLLVELTATGSLGQRLADMGFLPGLPVCVVRRAPLGDPLEVDLAGIHLCIRAEEGNHLLVLPQAEGEGRP